MQPHRCQYWRSNYQIDIAPRDTEVITLEDDTYASANVIRKQTKWSSKWLPEELRTQVLGAVTRIDGVELSALKPLDLKLLHCTPCDPWDGYQLVHSDHNLMGPRWMKDCIQVFIALDNFCPDHIRLGNMSPIVGMCVPWNRVTFFF